MADAEGETLESWLNKATNPSNRQEDWEYIIGFCDQINKELEGPQIAVRLLAHKIQSPQEWEAVQALTVLEACMKNCGRRFHNEVGKFRFLNELIKVVSPKYLGDRVSEKVKRKVVEMLYSWAVALPDEAKINEAYQMLKRQGIVSCDPEIPVDQTLIPSPPTRPKNPVFEDEEKSKLLAELLKSKNPEDLQEANRLIKNMVKEDEARMQKVTKRVNTLEEVNNNVKLLNEMLTHFNREESSEADRELIKELYERCDKMRRNVFKLATETEDNDNSLGDILQASDDLSRGINSYKKIVEGQAVNGETDLPGSANMDGSKDSRNTETLIDLEELDIPSPPFSELAQPPAPAPALVPANPLLAPAIPVLPPPPHLQASSRSRSSSQTENTAPQASGALSLLDEELLSLVPTLNNGKEGTLNKQWSTLQASDSGLGFFNSKPLSGAAALSAGPMFHAAPVSRVAPCSYPAAPSLPRSGPAPFLFPGAGLQVAPHSGSQALQDLSMLDLGEPVGLPAQLNPEPMFCLGVSSSAASSSVLGFPGPSATTAPLPAACVAPPVSHAMVQAMASSSAPGSPLFRSLSPLHPTLQGSPAKGPDASLANVHVQLDSIKPSRVLPVTAYDKNGVRVLLHFSSECPPGRPDVLVIVVSMLNTAPLPVQNVVLQAAVPKSMKVKLQPPSETELAPFNPILPPATITQVMLLANPMKEKVRLRYKLTFTLGDQSCTDAGEVDQFPPAEKWGYL
ncbi:ADP-ribosylation factor-binding protein GGA3-like isoform X2 [Acipenser ruthenus]|uniref:ADP-ribosylation factor-binding protein GGA3-like isoform X2 n=1 Tax=Acipenser ruthenus TaxID=7906 RepID=UPI0027417493|nr:ADP-ribosylation factor-binding protein GGA3-like isoform X2 [Acipenser ruthenus]